MARRSLRTAAGLAAGLMTLFAAGCRQDMQDQPKFLPQRSTTFFPDGRSARPQVAGTVARGQLHADSFFYTGLVNGTERDAMPFAATMTVMKRGQEQFNVYCTPCHSRVGNGDGMIVQRGYKTASNLQDARHLAQPLSHYFVVMTMGYGAMPDYAAQLTPEDRWAVAAYIRALQYSQNAAQKDVPAGTEVESLSDVAAARGLPASFAEPWALPATAVNPLPPDESQHNPGMAPAEPSRTDPAAPGMPGAVPGSAANDAR
jgi:mono/diheme cytochrome c family protein